MTRISILHVITTISRGGAENHLLELVGNQVEQGSRVAVAYLKGDGYWRAAFESLGVPVLALHMESYGEIRPVIRLRSFIRNFKPSIIHAHLPPAELYTRLALLGISRSTIPLVISKHNDERFYEGRGERMVGRWVAGRADRVIAISDAVRNYMIGQRGLDIAAEKVVTIRYGIVPAPYETVEQATALALRAQWGIPEEEFLIGTVARLVPQKALHVLLQGFARYLATATRSARLVLVGAGPLESELQLLSEKLGIQERLVWAGFREDIPEVMNAFDVFSLTSGHEGFGLVLLEAMAAGNPVVACGVSAIPEIVSDRATGLLIPSGDVEMLAKAFASLENDQFRLSLGEAGRERVKACFTVARMVAETNLVYTCCLSGRN